eukprot:6192870-Pleurochrysis_carterae.AAC.1
MRSSPSSAATFCRVSIPPAPSSACVVALSLRHLAIVFASAREDTSCAANSLASASALTSLASR